MRINLDFATLIPTLLTRKRISSGALAVLPPQRSWLPANAFLRALSLASLVAIAATLLHAVVLYGAGVETLLRDTVLVYKPVYGPLLSWFVTPYACW